MKSFFYLWISPIGKDIDKIRLKKVYLLLDNFTTEVTVFDCLARKTASLFRKKLLQNKLCLQITVEDLSWVPNKNIKQYKNPDNSLKLLESDT